MTGSIVVVGASHAAVQAIDTLHREGHGGQVILIGDESEPPYNRPPLSKKYFTGELTRERLQLRSAQFYEHGGVTMRLGVRVTAIDRAAQRLRLSGGGELAWEKLLLCVGSRARRLDVPGADLQGIHYLRTMADVDAIRADLASARRLVVIGAGYIGLEAAASARHLGLEVTVLEAAARPMQRVACPALSEFYRARHEREGVRIQCNVAVSGFTGDGRVQGVLCGAQEFPADVVITGVGIAPDVTLAAAAGLKCDNGIWVDESCRTSDPNVYAAATAPPSERPLRSADPARIRGQRCRAGPRRGVGDLWQGRAARPRPGSGRTSTMSSCRSRVSRRVTTGPSFAASRAAGISPFTTCRRAS